MRKIIKDFLKNIFRFLTYDFYVKYTEIPEYVRSSNKFYSELESRYAKEAVDFVKENCQKAMPFHHKHELLKHALKISNIEGSILEFGVFRGKSINLIASNTKQNVYGFDSFLGLPEDWSGSNHYVSKKHFDLKGTLPKCKENVNLIKGWFKDTIPIFLNENKENVKLMHIDCDLYSSTYFVLESFRNNFVPGSLIVFDEFYNFHGWKNHEYKALIDFKNKYNVNYEYIGFTDRRMLIRII